MPEEISIPLAWVGLDELPIAYANQFVIQFEPDGSFVLSIGQATAPAILAATPEEAAEQAAQVEFVPVRPLARISCTEAKLRELVAVLEVNLKSFEQNQSQIDPRS